MSTPLAGAWRALVVDDEPLARRTLRVLLEAERDIQVVGEADHGRAAIAAIRAERPDIVFLDIQMPGLTGLDVLDDVGVGAVPVLVFVTAYDQYALQAFEAQALDYLLKPFSDERFKAVIRRVRRALSHRARSVREARLVVRDGRRTIVLPWNEIDWIEAEDYCIRIHAGARRPLVRQSLHVTLGRLDPADVRPHPSIHHREPHARARSVAPLASGDEVVTLADGTALKLSRSFRAGFHARFTS